MRVDFTQRTRHLQWRNERRIATVWEPASGPTRSVFVVAPPFAEELNRSRRTLALSGRMLASAGHALIVFDPFGCGDSPGDFGDATWQMWCDDLREATHWASGRFGCQPALLALRAGSLFLPDAANLFARIVLWQPVIDGEKYLRQLLRIKVTRDNLSGTGSSTTLLMDQLKRGQCLEVAGYALSPELVLPIAEKSLSKWSIGTCEILWLETGPEADGNLGPASRSVVGDLRSQGAHIECTWVRGPQFWNTVEIAENTALAEATITMLARNGS